MKVLTYVLTHDDLEEPIVVTFDTSTMTQADINQHLDNLKAELDLALDETWVFENEVVSGGS